LKQFELVAKDVKLVLKENVLAVLSETPLNTVSSAIHNGGGLKKTKVIVNTQVTDEYGDRHLHDDPEAFVMQSFKKLGLDEEFVGMVTYAIVEDFALVSKRDGDVAVSVIATAGCTHAESAGESIELEKIEGTINIIILIDGNPSESCLVSTMITATEAKTAALRELDVRSRYSGDEATGTITDAMVVAETGRGPAVVYGGPASKIGQLVGYCTRKAVKEAVMKGKVGGFVPCRSLVKRLGERGFSVERLASELAKANGLKADAKFIAAALLKALEGDAVFASVVLAAVKLDEDVKVGLIPPQLGYADMVSRGFGGLLFGEDLEKAFSGVEDCGLVDLPPFLKQVLVAWLRRETGNLK
jgi:iron complex transport system ATP-binding protein